METALMGISEFDDVQAHLLEPEESLDSEQTGIDLDEGYSIIIIGAGGIGMEFAHILNSYGADVQILEYADRALPNEDADVSKELNRQCRRRGIPIQTNTRVDSVIDHGDHITVTHTDRNAHTTSVDAARAFICIGFCPNVENLGLDMVGVHLTTGGAIDIDDYMHTSAPHIPAIGDVTAKVQLAHVASAQGVIAAESIAGSPTMPLDYRMMPRVTFCQPPRQYDLVVVGAGSGGYVAGIRAAQLGMTVAIIEERYREPFQDAYGQVESRPACQGDLKVLGSSYRSVSRRCPGSETAAST
jgi:pyruvate/2-oxoglutarate dehydrogenase complex dihydrolipoamide dehydrogenase (E3) component